MQWITPLIKQYTSKTPNMHGIEGKSAIYASVSRVNDIASFVCLFVCLSISLSRWSNCDLVLGVLGVDFVLEVLIVDFVTVARCVSLA
jgi:hypothetical protein